MTKIDPSCSRDGYFYNIVIFLDSNHVANMFKDRQGVSERGCALGHINLQL